MVLTDIYSLFTIRKFWYVYFVKKCKCYVLFCYYVVFYFENFGKKETFSNGLYLLQEFPFVLLNRYARNLSSLGWDFRIL